MAYSVSYTISGVDKFSKPAKKIAASAEKMGAKVQNAGTKVAQAGTKTEQAAKKMSRSQKMMQSGWSGLRRSLMGYVGALGAYFAAQKVISTGARFEQKIAEVSAITGATGKNLKFIADESLRLARSTYTSADEVAEGFKLIASAKAELLDFPEKLAAVTEQAIILKNAAGVDLATASETLAKSLNQFGVGAEEAARFTDVLAAGAKFGASEIADTGEALKVSGTAANVAGLSFEETNAAIQALAAGGLKGSIAGRGLAAVLLRAQKAGLNFKKVGLAKGFELIKNAVNKIQDPQKRATAIMKTFGLENVKTIETLILQADKLEDLTEKMHIQGIAAEQANAQNRTFGKNLKQLGIIVDEKMIKLFERLKPQLNAATIAMINFVDSMGTEQINAIADGFMVIAKAVKIFVDGLLVAFSLIKGIAVYSGAFLGRLQKQQELSEAAGMFNYGDPEELKRLDEEFERQTKGAFDVGGKLFGVLGENKTKVEIEVIDKGGNVDTVKETSNGKTTTLPPSKKNTVE